MPRDESLLKGGRRTQQTVCRRQRFLFSSLTMNKLVHPDVVEWGGGAKNRRVGFSTTDEEKKCSGAFFILSRAVYQHWGIIGNMSDDSVSWRRGRQSSAAAVLSLARSVI